MARDDRFWNASEDGHREVLLKLSDLTANKPATWQVEGNLQIESF